MCHKKISYIGIECKYCRWQWGSILNSVVDAAMTKWTPTTVKIQSEDAFWRCVMKRFGI